MSGPSDTDAPGVESSAAAEAASSKAKPDSSVQPEHPPESAAALLDAEDPADVLGDTDPTITPDLNSEVSQPLAQDHGIESDDLGQDVDLHLDDEAAESDLQVDAGATLDVALRTAPDVLESTGQEAVADLQETDEATRIDRELGLRLQRQFEDSKVSVNVQSRSESGAGAPRQDKQEPSQQTFSPEASIDDLGPAFPEPEDWAIETRDDPISDVSALTPLPTEQPTSAKPSSEIISSVEQPVAKEPSQPSVDEDAWAGLKESSGGWPGLTGERPLPPQAPQAADGEYSRQSTDVYRLGQQPAGTVGARLIGIGGQDTGREFAVEQREMVVGRAPGCGILLIDNSVSREHARLLRDADVYTLIDQRSANGTFINGQRVDRGRVRSGDELGFGSTRFRFLEIGDVFKPVDASGAPVLPGARLGLWQRLRASPNFRSVAISVAIVAVTVLASSVILIRRTSSSGARPADDRVFEYYLRGIEDFKRREWSKAKESFGIVLGLDPTNQKGRDYLQAVAREIQAEKQLAAARDQRKAGELAQAYAQAATIVDSVYSTDAEELMRGINAEVDVRVVRARTTLDSGNPAEAIKLLDSVQRIRPGRPDVLALRDRAKLALARASHSGAPEVHGSAPSAVPVRPAGTSSPANSASAADRGLALFREGRIEDGIAMLQEAPATREVKILRGKIAKFSQVYASALEEHRAKRTRSAIKQLRQAKAFEAKITGGRSLVADEINRKLADMYYVEGIAPYLAGRFPEAYRSFRSALEASPHHQPSLSKLNDLVDKAKELLDQGYRVKDTDAATARRDWKVVLQIVPSSHEAYHKAKRWLDALPPR